MKILMVCLGNICRSPLAEGILQHKAKEKNLDWTVDSAGTGTWHIGLPPDERSIERARKYGLDISEQRARQFKVTDFDHFDKIYVMDASNYQNVMRLARSETDRAKVELILNELYPRQNRTVPDPYWNDDGFEQVYQMLAAACECIMEKYGAEGKL